MNMNDPHQLLEKLKAWKNGTLIEEDFYGVIWTSAHKLAEVQFEPAKDFFILGLGDSDWVWRESCVSFLGFHFPLNETALEKIRNLLLNDTNSHVRMAAASVLGGKSILPDYALNKAVAMDIDQDVRKAAYESILRLAGVSAYSIKSELYKIRTGEVVPSLKRVIQVLESENISFPDNYFGAKN